MFNREKIQTSSAFWLDHPSSSLFNKVTKLRNETSGKKIVPILLVDVLLILLVDILLIYIYIYIDTHNYRHAVNKIKIKYKKNSFTHLLC